jgi:hypothetical protein
LSPEVNVQAELAFIVDAGDRVTGVVFRRADGAVEAMRPVPFAVTEFAG